MAVIGDLVTRLGVDGRKFQSGLDKARGDARSFASDITKIVSGLAIYDIAKTGVLGLKDMLVETVKLSASAEVMRAEFAVLLGDVGKSAKFFGELEDFAARTSFNLESAGDSARQLMAAGVKEGNLLDTMQLLGDLSMGDANKLGFLSKAYTDVFNKGKLQGQEIKQFAENGVGIVAVLASSMGKTAGEIIRMSEAGEISFDQMQAALKTLTAEGGRFYGAMAARNSTLMGQWDSLMEGIQKTGRAIGDSMLPAIKDVVAEANGMLNKFNEMPDKIDFIGDVLETSFEVAMLSIRDNWDKMLQGMLADGIEFGRKHLNNMAKVVTLPADVLGSPLETARKLADPIGTAREAAGLGPGRQRETDLNAAVARLDALMARVQGPAVGAGAAGAAGNAGPAAEAKPRFEGDSPAIKALNDTYVEWDRLGAEMRKARDTFIDAPFDQKAETQKIYEAAQNALTKMAHETVPAAHKAVEKEVGGKKLKEGVSSLWDSLQSPLAEAQMAAQGMWDRGKIKAGAAMGTLSNIFSGDPAEKEKAVEPRLAGAMAAGSQEAYSTIVQAMIRQTDPNVKATEKQTRELKKALERNRPQPVHLVAAFEM